MGMTDVVYGVGAATLQSHTERNTGCVLHTVSAEVLRGQVQERVNGAHCLWA